MGISKKINKKLGFIKAVFLLLFFLSSCRSQTVSDAPKVVSPVDCTYSQTPAYNERPARVMAFGDTIIYQLPDSSKLSIFLRGDENLKRTFTTDWVPVLLNKEGYYEYAVENSDGNLINSGIRAHNRSERNSEENKYLRKKINTIRQE